MIKEVPCMDCGGKGFIAIYSEYSVWSERCQNCGGTGIVKVPMTNADRIRAMSDEELAAYLAEISGGTILKTYNQLGLSLSDEKSKKYLNELTAEYLKRLQSPENGGLTWNG